MRWLVSLLLCFLFILPCFAQTKEELIAEYQRLENLKQIILRQNEIIRQLKIIEREEAKQKEKESEEKEEKEK